MSKEKVTAHGLFEILRPYATILKVLFVLLAIDWCVRGPFFDAYVMAGLVHRYPMLRERTAGAYPSIVFDALNKLPAPAVRVALVGDSTILAYGSPDTSTIAYMTQKQLPPISPVPTSRRWT